MSRGLGDVYKRQNQVLPRQAAMDMAVDRVKKAMSYRRFSLFSCGPEFI